MDNTFLWLTSAGWTAIFTLILCVFTALLWYNTKIQSDNIRKIQRAYLSVEPLGIQRSRSDYSKGIGVIKIRNSGTSTASGISWNINLSSPCGYDFKPDDKDLILKGSALLGGRSSMRQNGHSGNSKIDFLKSETDDKEHLYLYVWGELTYEDGFSTQRTIRFCHRYNLRNFEATGIDAKQGRVHEWGNSST